MEIVLLSGIPGSGKSTFAHWLELNKGFRSVDVEKAGALERLDLSTAWTALHARPGAVNEFLEQIGKLGGDLVLDWGFPMSRLPVVSALKDAGVEICWFDGDRQAARDSFQRRGDVSIKHLDRQMQEIQKQWAAIQEVFAGRIIESVRPGPSYMAHEDLYRGIFGGRISGRTSMSLDLH